MDTYDVIIVGGGPAGLQCAKELAGSELRVLLLEKNKVFGDKLCAGGMTMKDMGIISLPDTVIEHKISQTGLHTPGRSARASTPDPFLFTVSRRVLGDWQRSELENTSVEVRTGSQVAEVIPGEVILENGEKIRYSYLVGADGYASIVRRFLGLEMKKRLIGYQYTLAKKDVEPVLEMFLDSKRFKGWYAWIFPHQESIAVGCCCDPSEVDHIKMRGDFLSWLEEKDLDTGNAKLESCPIACDFQGYHFDHIFLVGEAAGLASRFTGEGIYQALASGRDVARLIKDPGYDPVHIKQVLKYNRILDRILRVFQSAGPLRGPLQEFLIFLMSRRRVRERINAGFS